MKFKQKIYKINLPIYSSILFINFSNDISMARKKYNIYFGEVNKDLTNADALSSYSANGYFAIFLNYNSLKYISITHESFHVTHRILNYIDARFDVYNHETFAYLNGYLNDLIFKHINENKYKIKSLT